MGYKNIQEILPFVEKPSRYLGCETNTIRKDTTETALRFCLAFPDLYEIGTSHFGMQILYHLLNSATGISAERVFAPGKDMASCLKNNNMSLMSLESGTPLTDFDIVGFSLLYELNYTNILTMLTLAGIPLRASERRGNRPIVIAGGPCTCNPEPVADFFDALVIGDGEQVIMKLSRDYIHWKKRGGQERRRLLKKWSEIDGVYIPSFFNVEHTPDGHQVTTPAYPDYSRVKRAVVSDLETAVFPDSPVVPFGRPIHDRLRLEIARGCSRGCRFCQAGMIYRPVRERSVEDLVRLAEDSIRHTGYDDVSLLSLSTGDYTQLDSLMAALLCGRGLEHVAVSLPSVRAGSLSPELMNLIKGVRKTGFTIAPEAGSQRLRNVINKNITEEEVIETVTQAFALGWNVIKLYFMIGLPTETDEDLMGIVNMVKALSTITGPGRKKKTVNVSLTTFIPKPHTPFQWERQISPKEATAKIRMIHDGLKDVSNVRLKWQNQQMSLLEGLFARGDRRLSTLLELAHDKGCQLDGWTEAFNFGLWEDALNDAGIERNMITDRPRDISAPLPWDRIDIGVTSDFLRQERESALRGDTTDDCRDGICNDCGVCDFVRIEPKLSDAGAPCRVPIPRGKENKGNAISRYRIVYEKVDRARFLGHLEMVNIFMRAMRRAGIRVAYSEGFHPKPKMSFSNPLPVGMESLGEAFTVSIAGDVQPASVIRALNRHLPEGLVVRESVRASKQSDKTEKQETSYYEIQSPLPVLNSGDLDGYLKAREFILSKPDRKGGLKKINLKDIILKIELVTESRLVLQVRETPGMVARPLDIIKRVFNLPDPTLKQLRVVRIPRVQEHV